MPTSMASAPAAAKARTTSVQSSPSPPVTYGTSSLRPASRRSRRCDLERPVSHRAVTEDLRDLGDVLVAPPGQVEDHDPAGQLVPCPQHPGQRVGRLEGGDDPLGAGEHAEGVEHLRVGRPSRSGPGRSRRGGRAPVRCPGSRGRPRSTPPPPPARARPGGGTTSSRARCPARRGPRRRRRPAPRRPARRPGSSAKPEKRPMAFEPPPDARRDDVGVAAEERPALLAGLVADHAVELPHHPRVRVRAHHRAEQVVARLDRGHPVAHGLVDGVLERAAARRRGTHLGAEQPHAEDVERLALHVDLAHVDDAVEAEERRRGGAGDAVLARAGLGDEPALAHALREQGLAQHVVDLVGSGVVEVLPLEQHGAAELLGEAAGLVEHRGPPGVVAQQPVELGPERRVGPRLPKGSVELGARHHERLRDVPPPEVSEPPRRPRVAHHRLRRRPRRTGSAAMGEEASARSRGAEPRRSRTISTDDARASEHASSDELVGADSLVEHPVEGALRPRGRGSPRARRPWRPG